MPSAAASSGAMASVHCVGVDEEAFVVERRRSMPARVAVGMVSPPCSSRRRRRCLPAVGMVGADAGDVAAGQQAVPVEPLEHQLAEVVEPRLLQQRQPDRAREVPGERLGVVVEVDEQRLVEAGLDEAVGVAVEAGVERLAGEEAADVLDERLALEVGDRPGLRGGHVGGVADHEDVRRRLGLQRVLVGRARSRARRRGPGERPTYAAPPCSGTTTARSKGTSRPS